MSTTPYLIFPLALCLAGATKGCVASLRLFADRLSLPPQTVGLLLALAADGPELASAASSFLGGRPAVGTSLLVGASLLNLAAIAGLGTLLFGRRQRDGRDLPFRLLLPTLLGGGAALFAGAGASPLPLFLLGLLPFGGSLRGRFVRRGKVGLPLLWAVGCVGGIALFGHLLVGAVLALHLAPVVAGPLLLAPTAAAPNIYAGLRLGQAGEGAAMAAACFYANGINLLLGLALPLLFGATVGRHTVGLLLYLLLLTPLALLALRRPAPLPLLLLSLSFFGGLPLLLLP